MAIEWTENLSVGVGTIDEQHKMLFKKADELFEAGKNGKAKDYISQLLAFWTNIQKNISAMKRNICKASITPNWQRRRRCTSILSVH